MRDFIMSSKSGKQFPLARGYVALFAIPVVLAYVFFMVLLVVMDMASGKAFTSLDVAMLLIWSPGLLFVWFVWHFAIHVPGNALIRQVSLDDEKIILILANQKACGFFKEGIDSMLLYQGLNLQAKLTIRAGDGKVTAYLTNSARVRPNEGLTSVEELFKQLFHWSNGQFPVKVKPGMVLDVSLEELHAWRKKQFH